MECVILRPYLWRIGSTGLRCQSLMIGFRRQTVEHSGKEHKSQPPTEGGSTINTNTGKIGSMDITPSCYALHVSRVFEHLFY